MFTHGYKYISADFMFGIRSSLMLFLVAFKIIYFRFLLHSCLLPLFAIFACFLSSTPSTHTSAYISDKKNIKFKKENKKAMPLSFSVVVIVVVVVLFVCLFVCFVFLLLLDIFSFNS